MLYCDGNYYYVWKRCHDLLEVTWSSVNACEGDIAKHVFKISKLKFREINNFLVKDKSQNLQILLMLTLFWGKVLFDFHVLITDHHWGTSGKEFKEEQRQELGGKLLTGLFKSPFYTTHAHLPSDGSTHSGLSSLTSNRDGENDPPTCPHANLREAVL